MENSTVTATPKPEEKPGKKRILTACLLCGTFLLGTFFNHHIDLYLRDVNYLIISAVAMVLFIWIVIYFIKSIRKSIKKRKQRRLKPHLPTLIYALTLILCYILPSSEMLESPTVIEAGQREAPEHQASLKLRRDNSFELHFWAVFGYNHWYTGTYTKQGDTIMLNYKDDATKQIGSKLVKKNGMLIPADQPANNTKPAAGLKIYKDAE